MGNQKKACKKELQEIRYKTLEYEIYKNVMNYTS